MNYQKAYEKFEYRFFKKAVVKNKWNISRTAKDVGFERSYLHRKLKKLGIRRGKSR